MSKKQTILPISQCLRAKLIDEFIEDTVINLQDAAQAMRLAQITKYARHAKQDNGKTVEVVLKIELNEAKVANAIKITVKPIKDAKQ